uniref:Uncharacterized protein n=1 Tax=Leptocylindrus danicus TaxID=163516 RepID=A0A7S2KSA7_9STRA|mmetsp:Transcript_26146/g.38949  ORF Transcript_26146/g.38949 Transcript_26146/m.38949 type:complete len:170 (+) Transcript_26146:170-679(+)
MELMLCSFIDEDGGDDEEESCGGEFMLSSLLIEEACEDVIDSDSEEESCVDEVDADDETFLKSSESVEVEDTQAQVELCAMARGTKKKIQGGEVGFRNPDIWIADTGASCHLTADDAGAVNRKCVSSKVIVWKASGEMVGDLFTKNLGQSLFNTHTSVFSGVDEYLDML